MPEVVTRIPDALELMQYGYFYPWKYPRITIDAADAITITAAQTDMYFDRYTATAATESVTVDLADIPGSHDWCALLYHYDFGVTSQPDKVYYQIIEYGNVLPQQFKTSFVAGGYACDMEYQAILPPFNDKVTFEFWNVSDPAEDVWAEVRAIFYLFPYENLDKILALSLSSLLGGEGGEGGEPPADMSAKFDRIIWLLEYMAKLRVKFER